MLKVKTRIWLENNHGDFIAKARIDLLKKIDELGSISKAAKSLNMSYRKAWQLTNAINKLYDKPLIIKITGGTKGGGTQLTNSGKKAILEFKNINSKWESYLRSENFQFD
jgi:molybdate transport system regulatory protein